jgi:hypothetical protein
MAKSPDHQGWPGLLPECLSAAEGGDALDLLVVRLDETVQSFDG